MLVKSNPGVNFINILQKCFVQLFSNSCLTLNFFWQKNIGALPFWPIFCRQKISNPKHSFVIFGAKIWCKKCKRTMLAKLTPVLPDHAALIDWSENGNLVVVWFAETSTVIQVNRIRRIAKNLKKI
jgi:hypothetical protein